MADVTRSQRIDTTTRVVAATIGAVPIALNSVLDQALEIGRELADGIGRLGDRIDETGWTGDAAELVVDDLGEMWTAAAPGAMAFGALGAALSTSVVAIGAGGSRRLRPEAAGSAEAEDPEPPRAESAT